MINILANITRKHTLRIRQQLPTPIHLHQHIKITVLLTSSCHYICNITFLILLLKKKDCASQKMATFNGNRLITSFTYLIWAVADGPRFILGFES